MIIECGSLVPQLIDSYANLRHHINTKIITKYSIFSLVSGDAKIDILSLSKDNFQEKVANAFKLPLHLWSTYIQWWVDAEDLFG